MQMDFQLFTENISLVQELQIYMLIAVCHEMQTLNFDVRLFDSEILIKAGCVRI